MPDHPFSKQIRFLIRQNTRNKREKKEAERRVKEYEEKIRQCDEELTRLIRRRMQT